MKAFLILTLVLLAGGIVTPSAANANDGGLPGITVQDLKIQTRAWNGKETIETAVPKGTTTVASFTGKEAAKLMMLLPHDFFVYGNSDVFRHNSKALKIAGNNGNSIYLNCRGGDFDFDDSKMGHRDQTPGTKFKPFKDGPQCEIMLVSSSVTDENSDEDIEPFKPTRESWICR